MTSKAIELCGMALIAWAVALLLGVAAGLLTGGIALLLIGSTTDDAEVVRLAFRGAARLRSAYRRQITRERRLGATMSPHPPLTVDPDVEAMARRLATDRIRRGDGRIREAMP